MKSLFKFDQQLHGEDAPAVVNDKSIIICDGVGAGGQNKHTINGEEHSSAYFASRLLSKTCSMFFESNYDRICENMNNAETIVAELKVEIKQAFDSFVAENNLVKRFKGKDLLMLPSTMVAVIYKCYAEYVEALVINAGDSRAFVMDPQVGLQQISKDDVDGDVDAYEKSTITTNKVNQERDFHLNYGHFILKTPCVLFASSDGCYDYIETPMEFEYVMEAQMVRNSNAFVNNPTLFGEKLGEFIKTYTRLQDDCSLAGCAFDVDESVISFYKERAKCIEAKYVIPSKKLTNAIKSASEKNETELQFLQTDLRKAEKAFDELIYDQVCSELKKIVSDIFSENESGSDIQEIVMSIDVVQQFINSIEDKKAETRIQHDSLDESYRQHLDKLKKLFADVLSKERESTCNSFLFYDIPIFGSFFSSDNNSADVSYLEDEFYNSRNAFYESVKSIYAFLDHITKCNVDTIANDAIMTGLDERYSRLKNDLSKWIGCAKELKESQHGSGVSVDANVLKADFSQAWKSGFSKYRKKAAFSEVCTIYDECISMQSQLENYIPFGEHDAQKMLKEFVSNNKSLLIKSFKPLIEQFKLDKTKEYLSYRELMEKEKSLRWEILQYVEEKKSLWTDYKVQYERFLLSDNGGVV